jgi:putative ABC transport system permease protein
MLRNYFIITWRSLSRHKLFSAISIIGLATGMAACLLILLLIATTMFPMGPTLKDEFPEVRSKFSKFPILQNAASRI